MKILNFLKKKKIDVKKIEPKIKPEKLKQEKAKLEKPKEKKKSAPVRKISDLANRVLKFTHISEKATYLANKNQYVFRIFPRANKTEVKKAIEEIYGVNVVSVNIVKISRKKRRLGKTSGWRKAYKKAIVKVKKPQKIEILSQ